MTNNFRAILAEQDSEFTFHIKSTNPLHDDDTFNQLQLSLIGFDLRSLDRVSYNELDAAPNEDTDTVYQITAVLGVDVTPNVLQQQIAMFTGINWKSIAVRRPGEKFVGEITDELGASIGEYKPLSQTAADWDSPLDKASIDPHSQSSVGQARVDAFMKELTTQRNDREKLINTSLAEPKLTEAFSTSHQALNDIGYHAKKGFYIIERYTNRPSILNVVGPVKVCPDNFPYISDLNINGAGTFKIAKTKIQLVESDLGFRYTESTRDNAVMKHYQVELDSGDISYSAVVLSESMNIAKIDAINDIAAKHNLAKSKLLVKSAEVVV